MKKLVLAIVAIMALSFTTNAQRFTYINGELAVYSENHSAVAITGDNGRWVDGMEGTWETSLTSPNQEKSLTIKVYVWQSGAWAPATWTVSSSYSQVEVSATKTGNTLKLKYKSNPWGNWGCAVPLSINGSGTSYAVWVNFP